jgi:hypothetical protein
MELSSVQGGVYTFAYAHLVLASRKMRVFPAFNSGSTEKYEYRIDGSVQMKTDPRSLAGNIMLWVALAPTQ